MIGSSPDYSVDVDGESTRTLAEFKVADETMERFVLKTNLAEPKEACHRADAAISSFLVDAANFDLDRMWAAVSSDFCLIIYSGITPRCHRCG